MRRRVAITFVLCATACVLLVAEAARRRTLQALRARLAAAVCADRRPARSLGRDAGHGQPPRRAPALARTARGGSAGAGGRAGRGCDAVRLRLGLQPPVGAPEPRPGRVRPARHGALRRAALPEPVRAGHPHAAGAGTGRRAVCAVARPTACPLHDPGLGRRHRCRAARRRRGQDHPVRRLVRDQGRARVCRQVPAARGAPAARLGRRADRTRGLLPGEPRRGAAHPPRALRARLRGDHEGPAGRSRGAAVLDARGIAVRAAGRRGRPAQARPDRPAAAPGAVVRRGLRPHSARRAARCPAGGARGRHGPVAAARPAKRAGSGPDARPLSERRAVHGDRMRGGAAPVGSHDAGECPGGRGRGERSRAAGRDPRALRPHHGAVRIRPLPALQPLAHRAHRATVARRALPRRPHARACGRGRPAHPARVRAPGRVADPGGDAGRRARDGSLGAERVPTPLRHAGRGRLLRAAGRCGRALPAGGPFLPCRPSRVRWQRCRPSRRSAAGAAARSPRSA